MPKPQSGCDHIPKICYKKMLRMAPVKCRDEKYICKKCGKAIQFKKSLAYEFIGGYLFCDFFVGFTFLILNNVFWDRITGFLQQELSKPLYLLIRWSPLVIAAPILLLAPIWIFQYCHQFEEAEADTEPDPEEAV